MPTGLCKVAQAQEDPPSDNINGSMQVQPLTEHIDLFPLTQSDPYLRDPVTWDQGAVMLDERTGAPYYHLLENAGICAGSNSILHRSTGLLFIPHHDLYFDESNKQVINRKNQSKSEPLPNQVFDGSSLLIFERCLALVCTATNAENWSLARMPVASTPFPPIRRVNVDELPKIYQTHYALLLDKWQRQLMVKKPSGWPSSGAPSGSAK